MNVDYCVRITERRLLSLQLIHLESGIDLSQGDDVSDRSQIDAIESELTGYSEWLDQNSPEISIGFDWVMGAPHGLLAVRERSIRTNLMLVDESGADLGLEATTQACEQLLRSGAWHAAVLDTIDRVSRLQAAPNGKR